MPQLKEACRVYRINIGFSALKSPTRNLSLTPSQVLPPVFPCLVLDRPAVHCSGNERSGEVNWKMVIGRFRTEVCHCFDSMASKHTQSLQIDVWLSGQPLDERKHTTGACDTGGGEFRPFKDSNPLPLISNMQPRQGLVLDLFIFWGTNIWWAIYIRRRDYSKMKRQLHIHTCMQKELKVSGTMNWTIVCMYTYYT